jgi:hypothetical protein
VGAIAGTLAGAQTASAAGREQSTQLISRAAGGGLPNGPSTNAVISGDRRYASVIAFESEASNLVEGDGNGAKDVFAIQRAGRFGNNGSGWSAGRARLISRGRGGQPADGPSYAPAVDGSFTSGASCVAFLSAASNLVAGDTNGKVDAFVSRGPGGAPVRVSAPGGKQAAQDTTDVDVSGDCKRIAFVTGGTLYVRVGDKVTSLGAGVDPSWSTGKAQDADLVYTGTTGVVLSDGGRGKGKLVARGGRNPAFNNLKRSVVAYEKQRSGHTQVLWHDLGKGERAAGETGDADSRDPVIGNSGYYIAFESDASNLQTNAGGARSDDNGAADVYLFTDARDITLLESVQEKGQALPGGGANPSMSFYANYIVWDSPAPLGTGGPRQVYMRYLGPV